MGPFLLYRGESYAIFGAVVVRHIAHNVYGVVQDRELAAYVKARLAEKS